MVEVTLKPAIEKTHSVKIRSPRLIMLSDCFILITMEYDPTAQRKVSVSIQQKYIVD